jgi:hypothetical protein
MPRPYPWLEEKISIGAGSLVVHMILTLTGNPGEPERVGKPVVSLIYSFS